MSASPKHNASAGTGFPVEPALKLSEAHRARNEESLAKVVPAPSPWWQNDWFLALLLIAVTFVVYTPALHGGFLWDDDAYISQNTALRSSNGLWQIWFQPGVGRQYYPLSFTCFWVGYQFWGLNSLGYHILDVFFHALASVFLWQVLKSLKVRGALLAGALFALHPVCVMSAAWMNEIKNTLSGSLALGMIWAYVRFEGLGIYAQEEGPKRSWKWYALALVLFQLAMFAKSAASFIPVSLFLIIWWQRDRIGWRDIVPLVPLVGLVAVMGRLTIYIERTSRGASGADFTLTFAQRILISGRSFWFYLGKLFVPWNLTFIYPRWEVDPTSFLQWLYPLAMVALLVVLWRLRRTIGKGTWAALMHFYVSTSLLILMVVMYRMRYSFVSDHWLYFGAMSMIALIGAGIARGLDALGLWGKPAGTILSAGLLLLLGALSWEQSGMYKNLETLWRTTIARNPGCWMAENNLGNMLLQKGHANEAADLFRNAILAKPNYEEAMNNLGNALTQKGRFDEALAEYHQALGIKPDYTEAISNIGYALEQKGRVVEAIDQYQQALKINPAYVLALNNLGNAYMKQGRVADSVDQYQKVLKIDPAYVPTINNLAYELASVRGATPEQRAQAVLLAQKADHLTGGTNPLIIDTLAAAYAGEGRFSEAIDTDWRAIERATAQKNAGLVKTLDKHVALYRARLQQTPGK